jgi:hypothetical protein
VAMKRGRPRSVDPLRTFPLRLGATDFKALERIMQAKGFKDRSKTARAAIRALEATLAAPAPPLPAPPTVPVTREQVKPCPKCRRPLPLSLIARSHHPTGLEKDAHLPRCPGVPP